ncbi:MAG: hypothetical protein LBB48_05265 [Treponema sp.]|nr:hypothetical protein [Treponema sp.]
MGAYLYAVLEANAEILKEVGKMKRYTLEKFSEEAGLAAKWRNQGLERGIERVAKAMLRKGPALEIIRESTGLALEEIKRLERETAL